MGWLDLIFSPSQESKEQKSRLDLEIDFLEKVKYENIDFFHLNGMECWAKVVKIYDADTVHCVFFINQKAYKFKIRLAEIDTAEKKSDDPAEKAWAYQGIKRLTDLVDGKIIYLKCHKWDKYGRLLGELYRDDLSEKSFNRILIDEGFGYEYHGGHREEFRDWAPWAAWLDYPDWRPSGKKKPIDNIGDNEVFEPTDPTVDFQKDNHVNKRQITELN